jgi:hypothetical protein
LTLPLLVINFDLEQQNSHSSNMAAPRGKIVVSYTGKDGKGYFEPDAEVAVEDLPGGASVRRISSVPKVPIPDVPTGGEHLTVSVSNNEGVTFLECEMAAGQLSPMHATPSIDYGVMISGEIYLILDSGEEKALK